MHTAGMGVPFYVPYALLRLGVPDETIGLFISVAALSGVISNVLWGYVGEKYGVRWVLTFTSAMACTAPLMAISVQYLPITWQAQCYFLTFALNGASMSGMMVGFMSYMLNIAPPRIRSTYLGLGFFKTARLGVEDTLTLFSRQTLPIDGKGTVKG